MIVEDHEEILSPMVEGLRETGCEVVTASDAAGGLELLNAGGIDLLVLDLNLPDRSGWDILDSVRRRHPRLLLLVVTARGALPDRLRGLREGADDYLAKPFALAELVARVQALLRRSRATPPTIVLDDLEVDVPGRRARRGGVDLELTLREFDLLHLLALHVGQPVARAMIGRALWQQPRRNTALDNVTDVHVAHLRRKLEAGGKRRLLHTVRGVGFQLSTREP
jgi:DNA-binding response OmpR family regulator